MSLDLKKFSTLLKKLITPEPQSVLSLPPFPASNFNSKSEGGLFIPDELAQDMNLSWKNGFGSTFATMPKLKAQMHTHHEWEKAVSEVTFSGPDADKALEEAKKVIDEKLLKLQKDVWTIADLVVKEMIEKFEKPGNYLLASPGYVFEEYFESDMPILHPDFRRVSAGEYVVEVISMDYKRSTRENPMVMAEMEIVDAGPHRGVTVKAYFVVRETGLVGWLKFIEACGFDEVKPEDDFNIKTCIGSRLRVYVNDEGWIRNYIKEYDA